MTALPADHGPGGEAEGRIESFPPPTGTLATGGPAVGASAFGGVMPLLLVGRGSRGEAVGLFGPSSPSAGAFARLCAVPAPDGSPFEEGEA
jgi:hypothetical protein